MPGPSAGVVALMAPLVVSLAGAATLPLEAVACAALSALAMLSRAPFWLCPPQPTPVIVAAVIAAVRNRIRIGISFAGGFRNNPESERRVCAAAGRKRG